MNIFLTSLMHPETANDYDKVIEHFELSVKSVCGQKNQDFKVLVVCNEQPIIEFSHPNLEYHIVDFYPAEKNGTVLEKHKDKAAKLMSGLLYIQELKPNYVYIYDADDWLSNEINGFLSDTAVDTCYFSDKGYLVDIINKVYLLKYGLYSYCGSTHALPYDIFMKALNLPKGFDAKTTKEEFVSSVPEEIIMDLLGGHSYYRFFELRGVKCKPFPFPSVAWLRNTGNNVREDAQEVPGLKLTDELLSRLSVARAVSLPSKKNSLTALVVFWKYALFSWARYTFLPDRRANLEI